MMLFIGPCENKRNKKKTGGIIVLFKDLLNWVNTNKINHKVIDTNKSNYKNKVKAFFCIYYLVLKNINKVSHVSLHGTAKDYLYFAPFVVFLSKLLKRKVHLRKFAGNFDDFYYKSNCVKKHVFNYTLKNADALFFETKKLVTFGKSFNKNTYWLPNTREKPNFNPSKKTFNNKFVFISQVKNTKGVVEILRAKEMLSSKYIVDLYGPIMEDELNLGSTVPLFSEAYKGVLNHENVKTTLAEYDVVLLPTYHEGEGYPGIILEAFSLGMPVISTLWNSIDELVEDNFNGYLVPIKDHQALASAITKFNDITYQMMSANALKSFEQFDRDANYKRYMDLIC